MATDHSTKRCTKCGETKPLDAFRVLTSRKRGKSWRSPWCKPCKKAKEREWARKNPQKVSEQCRRQNLKRNHGMTPAQYDEMLEKQGGGCGICGRPENGAEKGKRPRGFAVDHNHGTGEIRGLLCTRCNNMLGNASDDIAILKAAIAYLRRYKRKT